jgi:RIO-like serine/threonine protein kinase
MLCQEEETRILRGVEDIMFNMRHVPVEDVAYFLVKYDPKLADKLAAAIEFNFLDKDLQNEQ